ARASAVLGLESARGERKSVSVLYGAIALGVTSAALPLCVAAAVPTACDAPEATVAVACMPPMTAVAAAELTNAATSIVATAHVMKPCAVSRKNTSCVCVLDHLVRRRPAT